MSLRGISCFVVVALAIGPTSLACAGETDDPIDPEPSELAQAVRPICGDNARIFVDDAGQEFLTGTCYLKTRESASLFNVLSPRAFLGHLVIEPVTGELEDLTLTQLERVQGKITIFGSLDMRALRVPALVEVTERLVIQNNAALEIVELPSLVRVGRFFDAVENPALPQCSVDALRAQLEPPPEIEGGFTGNCDDCC